MADDPQALEIVIRTRAELEGARAVEAQLERDIAQARLLGNEYAGLEAKLKSVRGALVRTGAETGQADEIAATGEAESVNGAGVQDDAVVRPQDEFEAPGGNRRAEAPTDGQVHPPRNHVTAESEEGGEDLGSGESTGNQDDGLEATPELHNAEAQEPTIGHRPERGFQPADELEPTGVTQKASADDRTLRTEGALEPLMDAQAQAAQAAGERMRAALERNGQATVSLMNRTLEVIEQQNRRLGEMERRVSELAGQIKSLRNP